MKTIQQTLESATFNPDYSYLMERPHLTSRIATKIFELFSVVVLKSYCPLTVKGLENLPDQPFLLCSNHNSHMDSVVLMISSGKGFKSFGMVAAKDYFFDNHNRRIVNLFMTLIPVKRQSNLDDFIESIVTCREFVKKRKCCIIVYPEGTRSLTGDIRSFKKGPAIISRELGLPIVPAYIKGTNRTLGKGTVFLRPGRVQVTFGEPIYPEEFSTSVEGDEDSESNSRFKEYRRITRELENRVNALCAQSNYAQLEVQSST